jgi:hypothetical protein
LRARYHELRRAAYGTSMPVTVEVEHVGGAFEKERAQMLEASATELVLSSLPAFVPLEAG